MKSRIIQYKPYLLLLLCILLLNNSINTLGQQSTVIDEVVAIVGKNPVLLSDIENDYMTARQMGVTVDGDLKCHVFEQILISNLLLNQAVLDSIEVQDSNVELQLDQRIAYFINNFGTIEKLEEYFNRPLQEIKEELTEVVRDELMIGGMERNITADVKITPAEVQKFFRDIPKDNRPYVSSKIELCQIVKYPKVSDAEVLRVKDLIRSYRQRIIDKEMEFSTMAILYSEDPGSNTRGGRYDDMDKSGLLPEFAAAAIKLKKDAISNVVKTEDGYHIIQLHDRKGDRISFSHILLMPKIATSEIVKVKKELDSIADLVRNGIYTFEDAARMFSEDENTRENGGHIINNYTGSTLLEPQVIPPDINYILNDLKVGEISNSFSMDGAKRNSKAYTVLLLKSQTKPHVANLKEDYQLIQDSTLNIKRNEVRDNWILEKIKTTYIKIDNSYKNCSFRFDAWIKEE